MTILAEDLTWQLGDTGTLLNSSDLGLPFVDITRVVGVDSPTFRETNKDHEGMDGGYLDAEFEQGRDVILEGTAYMDVEICDVFFDQLKAEYAPSQVPIPFYLKMPGTSERVLFVKPRGVRYDLITALRTGETPIQFLMFAEDPRQYTSTLQSASIPYSGNVAATGFGFNLEFNFGFGTAVVADSTSIFVGGNRPTPSIMTIEGPIVNPRIYNATLGLYLTFTIELLASDTLTIDTANRTVLFNGNSNVRGSLAEPNWWDLSPGITIFQFGGADTTGTATLTIQWRDAWR